MTAELAQRLTDMSEFTNKNVSEFLRYLVEKEWSELGPKVDHEKFMREFGRRDYL